MRFRLINFNNESKKTGISDLREYMEIAKQELEVRRMKKNYKTVELTEASTDYIHQRNRLRHVDVVHQSILPHQLLGDGSIPFKTPSNGSLRLWWRSCGQLDCHDAHPLTLVQTYY